MNLPIQNLDNEMLLNWDPNPPVNGNPTGQQRGWESLANILVLYGSNRVGKSMLLCMLAAGMVLEHPSDPGYAYWPCIPERNLVDPWYGPKTQEIRARNRQVIPVDPQYPRRKVWYPSRFKLPNRVWFSTTDMKGHLEVAMDYLPKLLADHLAREPRMSKDAVGVVTEFELDNGSSIVLKSARQGIDAFSKARVDLIINDEPFPHEIWGEQLARLLDYHGRIVIGATVPTTDSRLEHRANWGWLLEQYINPARVSPDSLPFGAEVIHMHLSENPHIDFAFAETMFAHLDPKERAARLHGDPDMMQGNCYFAREYIRVAQRRTTDPIATGQLKPTTSNEDGGFNGYFIDTTPIEIERFNAFTTDPNIDIIDILYRIFENPVADNNYIIAVDPADTGTDATAIQVWRWDPWRLVADVSGQLREELLAYEVYKLARFYGGKASIPDMQIPELLRIAAMIETNQGRVTCSDLAYGRLEKLIMPPLPQILRGPSLADMRADRWNPSDELGWRTTGESREILLGLCRDMLSDIVAGRTLMPDNQLLIEMFNFCYNAQGRAEGPRRLVNGVRVGDNRIFAAGLAHVARKQTPFIEPVKVESPIETFEKVEDGQLRISGHDMVQSHYHHIQQQMTPNIHYG